MSLHVHQGGAHDAAEAAAWVVRLSSDSAGYEDFQAFDAWLSDGDDRERAYDAAFAVWSTADSIAALAPVTKLRRPPRVSHWLPAAGAGMAAAVAGVFVLATIKPAEVYVTADGQRRHVELADGSKIDLNAASRMEVRWSRGQRTVDLKAGEAAFDVAKDVGRPFVIRSGERSVQVVGTEFDVKARGEQFSVAVRRGVVEVRGAADAPPVRLIKGDVVSYAEAGARGRKQRIDPDDAFAWTDGRLVFRDVALGEVVTALNQQFGAPTIAVEPNAGKLRFSGVLRLDDRATVVHRLTLAMPLSARETPSGIVLEMAKPHAL